MVDDKPNLLDNIQQYPFSFRVETLTNYLLTASHLGSALDITRTLLLYYYLT